MQESENLGRGCDPFFRLVYFLEELERQPGSRGMIVVYSGDEKNLLGNVTGYVKDAQGYIDHYLKVDKNIEGLSRDRVSVVASGGKSLFAQEFWIIPPGGVGPALNRVTFDWEGLTANYHFSRTCYQCDPSYPALSGYYPNSEDYVKILQQYPSYRGLITVYEYADLGSVVQDLTGKHKLPRNRYRVRIIKPTTTDGPSLDVNFYIVPGKAR